MKKFKYQKHIVFICLALTIVLMCCACSNKPKTPEQVVEKMQAALAATPCGQARLVMDMSMTMDAGEHGTMEMSTTTTNDITISQEPVSGYIVATTNVNYGGEESQTVTENYTVVEDDALVSYINSSGVWMKLSTGQTVEDLAKSASSVSVDVSNAAIDETVTEWEGREAVCLTTQISGDTLQTILGGMLDNISQQNGSLGEDAETVNKIDYSALTCNARIYLDKNTYLPISEEMTFTGMSDVLNPLYAEMGMTVDVTNCTATGTFLSYEAQAETVLPDGAKEKAEIWTRLLSGEPDNGNGTFTIREGTVLIDIAAPEGFELVEKDYDHVYFERDDHRKIKYTMYYSAAKSLTAIVDRRLNRYGDLPKKISREQMTLTGDTLTFDCDIVGVTWTSYEEGLMYAWAGLASNDDITYYLLVEVSDGYNDGIGNKKSADLTPEEFMTYLNLATPNDLIS